LEEEKQPLVDRKTLNTLQFMAIIAMLLTLITGNRLGFAIGTGMMCALKLLAMATFEDSKEAIFAAIYAGLTIYFFMEL